MRKKYRNEKGVTLVEMVVSIVIFVFVVQIFVLVLSNCIDIKERSETVTQNHSVAAQALEGTGTGAVVSADTTIEIKYSGTTELSATGKYHTYTLKRNKYKYFTPNP